MQLWEFTVTLANRVSVTNQETCSVCIFVSFGSQSVYYDRKSGYLYTIRCGAELGW